MKRFWLLAIVFSGLLAGCEKAVDFELDETPDKLVVEATIENGAPPVVVLTKSLNYFSKISPELLAGSFVHDAVVEMSNGTRTHRLKEYTTPLGGGYNLYYYSIDSANLSSAFTGALNTSYSLKIVSAGEEYTANTTIPNITKRIDSLWWRPMPKDSVEGKVVVMIRATDRPGFGDYVRYWTKTNDETLLPGFQSVFDDLVIDGTTYDLEVEPGIDRNEGWDDDDRAFRRGDTVLVKLSNIDKATYDFWRTLEYNYTSVGNPFSTPIKVLGNISNGALGYFGGYASQYRQLIIPR
jgi:hypothetical protein